MNLILLRHGYPMAVIQAADRNRYLAALAEADAGEPEPFLRFIIENVEASLRLMIRAARGESIDEPSDLDKKLALLKKQVLTRNDIISTIWNKETQVNFHQNLLRFWLDNAAHELERYDEFFLKKEININYRKANEKYSLGTMNITLTEAHNDIQNYSNRPNTEITSISLVFTWITFKLASINFNLRLIIDFNFNPFDFDVNYRLFDLELAELSSPRSFHLFSSVYKTEYDQPQIHETNYQLANKVYDFIAAKLAEADTPPA
jgi:hypothetical protein